MRNPLAAAVAIAGGVLILVDMFSPSAWLAPVAGWLLEAALVLGAGALLLGALHRTGPITWTMPYHAVNTVNTLGLSLFLAGVGTTAGAGFRDALTDPSSLTIMAAGLFITVASALICAVVGMLVLRLTWDESMGVAAGATTNPAIISYLNGQTGTELATRGYATVYPTAMIGKIVASQILLLLLL